MSYGEYLSLQKKDYVAIVTLSRPQKANVIAQPFYEAMIDLTNDIIRDKSLRSIAILADGKHFSAGTDLEYFSKKVGSEPGRSLYNLSYWQQAFSFWWNNNLPVVVGIQGACLGSGIELISACDIRICDETAYFFLGEVKVGMSTDLGGATRLTKIIGPSQTKRLLFTAEKIDANEALRIGLVDKMVSSAELRRITLETAQTIADMPPIAVQMAKKSISIAMDSSYAASLLAEQMQGIYCVDTKDKGKAIKAMIDKDYKPEYTYE